MYWDVGGFVVCYVCFDWIGSVSFNYICFECNFFFELVVIGVMCFWFDDYVL